MPFQLNKLTFSSATNHQPPCDASGADNFVPVPPQSQKLSRLTHFLTSMRSPLNNTSQMHTLNLPETPTPRVAIQDALSHRLNKPQRNLLRTLEKTIEPQIVYKIMQTIDSPRPKTMDFWLRVHKEFGPDNFNKLITHFSPASFEQDKPKSRFDFLMCKSQVAAALPEHKLHHSLNIFLKKTASSRQPNQCVALKNIQIKHNDLYKAYLVNLCDVPPTLNQALQLERRLSDFLLHTIDQSAGYQQQIDELKSINVIGQQLFFANENKVDLYHHCQESFTALEPMIKLEKLLGSSLAQAVLARNQAVDTADQLTQSWSTDIQAKDLLISKLAMEIIDFFTASEQAFDLVQAQHYFSTNDIVFLSQFSQPKNQRQAFQHLNFDTTSTKATTIAPQKITDILQTLMQRGLQEQQLNQYHKLTNTKILINNLRSFLTQTNNQMALQVAERLMLPSVFNNAVKSLFAAPKAHLYLWHQSHNQRKSAKVLTNTLQAIVSLASASPLAKNTLNKALVTISHQLNNHFQHVFEQAYNHLQTSDPRKNRQASALLTSWQNLKGTPKTCHLTLKTLPEHVQAETKLQTTLWKKRAQRLGLMSLDVNNTEHTGKIFHLSSWLVKINTQLDALANTQDIQKSHIDNLKSSQFLASLEQLGHFWEEIDAIDVNSLKPQDYTASPELDDLTLGMNVIFGQENALDTDSEVIALAENFMAQDTDKPIAQTGVELCNQLKQLSLECSFENTKAINAMLELYEQAFNLNASLAAKQFNVSEQYTQLLLQLEPIAEQLQVDPVTAVTQAIHHEIVSHLSDIKLNSVPQDIIDAIIERVELDTNSPIQPLVAATNQFMTSYATQSPGKAHFDTKQLNKLIQVLLPLEQSHANSPSVHLAQKITNMSSLGSTPNQIRLAIEAQQPLLNSINTLLTAAPLLQTTADQHIIRDILQQFISVQASLKQAPRGWVQVIAQQRINQFKSGLTAPDNPEAAALWSERLINIFEVAAQLEFSTFDLADATVQLNGGVNLKYYYTDEDIETLLQHKIHIATEAMPQASKDGPADFSGQPAQTPDNITISLAQSSLTNLKTEVTDWLSKPSTSDNPSILALPYCPLDEIGNLSYHWTAILISNTNNNRLNVAVIDPLEAVSFVPDRLKLHITRAVKQVSSTLDKDYQLDSTSFQLIQHSKQSDLTSCGPFIVHDVSQAIDAWKQNNRLPTNITKIDDAVALRQQHVATFGGLESRFGQRQMWNLQVIGGIEQADLVAQEDMLEHLVQAFNQVNRVYPIDQQSTPPSLRSLYRFLDRPSLLAMLNKKNGLSAEQLMQRAFNIFLESSKIQNHLLRLRFTHREVHNQLKSNLKSVQSEHFDASQFIQHMKSQFQYLIQSNLIDPIQEVALMQAFFPQYSPEADFESLDLVNIEAIRMAHATV